LHRFKISGKIAIATSRAFPALPDTGPPSTAGFVFLDGLFLRGRRVPANLPVGRDLTIRRKIENGRYYCAFGPLETAPCNDASTATGLALFY
jgi:hypothetical protein